MNRIQIKFIKDALQYQHLLTEWEIEFINDLAEKDEDYQLSKSQNKVLNRISDKTQ